ncbi:MAG: pyruvate kinase, partial [Wenzhouxiangellaceae bacterium]|nr:pyruvate kinase [Wenzhouxiangellaceae bacterium]
MKRRTKIVATLGPATDDLEAMEQLIRAGCDVVRINFSHGDAETHARRIKAVRAIARELDTDVAVLADLSGPKIRIDRFRDGSVELQAGQEFVLVAEDPPPPGDSRQVGVAYLGLPKDVSPGSELLLDDGLMSMRVERVEGTRIVCKVLTSGRLYDRKGLNLRGGGLSLPGISEADEADIRHAADWQVDYLAVSFPRSAEDIERARTLLRRAGGEAYLVSKIERTEAIENLDAIIEASDAVLVARGDLGVEIGEAELPGLQKRIISASLNLNRPVITATQMMQSMVESPIPT